MRPAHPIGKDTEQCKECNGFGVIVEIRMAGSNNHIVQVGPKLEPCKQCDGSGLRKKPGAEPLTPHTEPVKHM